MYEPEKLNHDSHKTTVKDQTSVESSDGVVEGKQRRQMSRRTGILIIIISTVLILMLISGLIGVSMLSRYNRYNQFNGNDDSSMMSGWGGSRWHTNMPTVYIQSNTTNSAIQITGVVSAVNGDTITIIGNGTSTSIKTSNGTTYNTVANKVNVNDTVIVTGVKSGDTFMANSVDIVNN